MWAQHIPGLLDSARLERLDLLLADAPFVDGRGTAGPLLALVKMNEQIERAEHPATTAIDELLSAALFANPQVKTAAFPAKIVPPLIVRYRQGMAYGAHCDNGVMATNKGLMRSDLSCTIFLSDPQHYSGGELEIETAMGVLAWKLPRGDAILYPSGAIHRVTPVTAGERLVAVTWMQSFIADAHRRTILADVERLNALVRQRDPMAPEALLGTKVYGDLVRMWAEG